MASITIDSVYWPTVWVGLFCCCLLVSFKKKKKKKGIKLLAFNLGDKKCFTDLSRTPEDEQI